MRVILLGTGAALPTPERRTSATAMLYEGEMLLFDCGEGTQLQLHHRHAWRPCHRDHGPADDHGAVWARASHRVIRATGAGGLCNDLSAATQHRVQVSDHLSRGLPGDHLSG